jgi:biopolymer transport protein ExbD
MKITSPIDGKVQKIFQQAGEAPEAHARIIRVVKLDPLWVDVPMPISQAASTQVGRQAIINFPAYGKADPRPQTGKVIFIAPIEEAASQTVTVRVEVPNANQRRAGERVNVQFLDTMAPAGAPATTEQRILGTLPAVGPTHSSAAPKVAATVHVRSIGGNVAYDVDGSGECVSDPESLYSALVQRRTGGDDAVVIQVERDVEWKYAVEVFNQAVRAKYKNVGFAGSPDKAATALAAPIPTTMPTAADAPPCISPTATHPASGPPTTQAATTQPAATASTEPATESRKYIIKILQARVEAQQGIGLTWKPEHADSSTTAPTTAPAVGNK